MPFGRDEDCVFCRIVGGGLLLGCSGYIVRNVWNDKKRWRAYGRRNLLYSAGTLTFAACITFYYKYLVPDLYYKVVFI